MELIPNYETNYICSQISDVVGRRYNIRPDLPEGIDPDIKGYMIPEIVAGLFRAWKLNELHYEVLSIVNRMQVVDARQIARISGLKETNCRAIIEKCVVLGLLCENKIIFKDGSNLTIYMVDTGGIFALSEAGSSYMKLSYTSGIDERINIYRKNIYLAENKLLKTPQKLYFFESVIGKPVENYRNSILLFDSGIAEKLRIKEKVLNELKRYSNTIIFDLNNFRY